MRGAFFLSVVLFGLAGFARAEGSRTDDRQDWLSQVDLSAGSRDRIAEAVADLINGLWEAGNGCILEVGSDWAQWSRIEFSGPGYLTVLVGADFWCRGTAHPNAVFHARTFDLSNGRQIDWSDLLGSLSDVNGQAAGVVSAPLQDAFLAAIAPARDECVGPLGDDGMRLALWLDADRRAVAVTPASLAHADRACSETVYLTGETLNALRPSEKLRAALANAHQD
jgi:hypothetical protein